MKYRPSKWFLRVVLPVALLAGVLWFGVLPEMEDARALPVKGEIAFREKEVPLKETGTYRSTAVLPPMTRLKQWMDISLNDLMRWEHNPWKRSGNELYPGGHYQEMLGSKDPKERAKAMEIQRLAEAWMKRLMERYPELAVTPRPVPDERNGFLKWLEFSDRRKELAGAESSNMGLPKSLTDYLAGNAPWNPAAAREWLAANAGLMAEVRAISALEEASSDGIPVERYGFIHARLAKEAADVLMMEARLAVESGDVASAMESFAAVQGLIHHLSGVESPTLLHGTVSILLQLNLEKRFFSEILPSLQQDNRNLAGWESLVNPQMHSPAEYARLMRGEWSVGVRQWILPAVLDSEDPLAIRDGGDLIDVFSLPYREAVLAYGNAKWSDKQPVLSDPADVARGLTLASQSMVSQLMIGAEAWRKGMAKSQHSRGLNQAAFQILKGNTAPVDPVWGKRYEWDPATRTLSMPASPEFEGMDIKPVVLPKM
ncbi:MAG: hypothetical protein EOP88_05935 [Verrucomicrobiaceae bacterium]|nr:MAG: hypothetical protein EOP88_05935 [Verrucomicrobiaceae bacterium]